MLPRALMFLAFLAITASASGAESATLQDMLGAHMDRVMRKSGILLPTRHGEPVTNWFGRVVMEGADALPSGYNFIQLRDSDGWAEVRDETGALTREVAPIREDAAFVLGDLFGFLPSEDTPPELRLSHLVSKWLVCHSQEESDAIDLTDDEWRVLQAAPRRLPRLASAPLVVTNLMVTAITAESDRVTFVTEWPSSMSFPHNRLDLYSSVDLRGAWSFYGSYDVAGVNAITTTVQKASIPGYLEYEAAAHDPTCYVITNIVASAFEPNVAYTNRHWNCEHKARTETPGFFRWADQTDSDGDGLFDAVERWVYHTDPNVADTDGDGLSDGWELNHSYNPHSTDSNGDGILDAIAASLNLSATTTDTDGDGLSDAEELNFGTSPTDPDSDGDGMNDGEEKLLQRDPTFDEAQMVDSPEGLGNCYTVSGTAQIVSLEVAPEDEENFVGLTIDTNDPSGAGLVRATNPEFTVRITGTTFTPLITGEYAFQIESDDEGELTVGHVTAAGSYYNGSQEVRGIFKAGVPYPVSVKLHNRGGPAQLHSVVFGRLTKVYPAVIINKFDKPFTAFEESYLNLQGDIVARTAECVTNTIIARSGSFSSRLIVRDTELDKMNLISGDVISQQLDEDLRPDEIRRIVRVFSPITKSDYPDDVQIVASLESFESRSFSIDIAKLTIFEVLVEADASFPITKHRHAFGPSEIVKITLAPFDSGARIELSEGVDAQLDAMGSFRMPPVVTQVDVSINRGNTGLFLNPLITVAPTLLSAINCGIPTSDDWLLASDNRFSEPPELWSGMFIELALHPMNVNFSQLSLMEGYCATTNPRGSLSYMENHPHDSLAGAGKKFDVENENYCGKDIASLYNVPTNVSNNGFASWDIPVYWLSRFSGDELCYLISTNTEDFVYSTNGRLTVRKFGCTSVRDRNGMHTVTIGE